MHRILSKEILAPDVVRFWIEGPHIARKRKPGQFVIVRTGEDGERIPLTIADVDRARGAISIIVQAVGKSTRQLNALNEGDAILDLAGPLGRATEIHPGRKVCCIGGGIGTAVVYPIACGVKALHGEVVAIIGGRTKDLVILEQELRAAVDQVIVTTDDGIVRRQGAGDRRAEGAAGRRPPLRRGGCRRTAADDARRRRGHAAARHSHDREPEPGDGGRHGHVRRVPRVGWRANRSSCASTARSSTATRWISRNWARACARTGSRKPSRCVCSTRPPSAAAVRPADARNPTEPSLRPMAKKIIQKTKNPMPLQDPHERAHNFEEVSLGYPVDLAVLEAQRCIQCKNEPCIAGCPVEIDIPHFIKQVAERDFEGAYRTLMERNVLPAVCGRVCPQEEQCEVKCTLGVKNEPVAIGRLERFVADYAALVKFTDDTPPRAADRPQGGGGRLGPGRPDRGGRPGEDGPRRHDLRGPAQSRRRARVRHSRVPAAQGDRRARDRRPEADRRRDQDEPRDRPDVHRRRAVHRARLRRGVHRHGRRPPDVPEDPGHQPDRRLLGERVPDPLEPDEGVPVPRARTRRPSAAGTWPSSAAATRRWTPCARRCASAPSTPT